MFVTGRNITKVAALALLIFICTAGSAWAEAYISAYSGAFIPGDNYSQSWSNHGTDVGLSYLMVNEYAGFEVALHGYTIDAVKPFKDRILAKGLDFIVHFQKENADFFQPFAAVGLGYLKTTLESPLGDENDSGFGVVAKLGARFFITKQFFMSGYYKRFRNNSSVTGFGDDMGGDAMIFEVGIVGF